MDDFDLFNEIYDQWVDNIINTQPLTTSRLNNFRDVIDVNQQIVNNIYNIRRHLEFNLEDEIQVYTDDQDNYQDDNYNDDNIYPDDVNINSLNINHIFDILNESINETIDQEFEDVKVTLTPEQFSNFKNEKINSQNVNDYLNKQCNICMDNYNLDESITFLVCNHYFHTDCIKNWLCNEKVTCPICRKDNRE